MNMLRKILAMPFIAIGFAFAGIGALILGDQPLDLLDSPRQTHH
jgi:hypothetical protein